MCRIRLFGGFCIKLFFQKDKLILVNTNNLEEQNTSKKSIISMENN